MSFEFHIPEQAALAAHARSLLEAGVAPEIVLGVLRKGGLGLLNSIKVWSDLTGLSLIEAKVVVQKSRAWQHTFPRDAELQGWIATALEALRAEEGL